MRLEQRRQNEIVRLPFPACVIGICGPPGDPDQRFSRERVDWFTPSAILNREQSKLFEINAAAIRRRQIRLAATCVSKKHAAQRDENEDERFQAARI